MIVHVIPLNDLREHERETDCHCGPKLDFEHGIVVTHASYDQRELFEPAGVFGEPWLCEPQDEMDSTEVVG